MRFFFKVTVNNKDLFSKKLTLHIYNIVMEWVECMKMHNFLNLSIPGLSAVSPLSADARSRTALEDALSQTQVYILSSHRMFWRIRGWGYLQGARGNLHYIVSLSFVSLFCESIL